MIQKRVILFALWAVYTLVAAAVSARADSPVLPADRWLPSSNPILSLGGAPPHAGAQVQTLSAIGDRLFGAQWRWSPAKPHHACMVRLQRGSSAGSGVYVSFGRWHCVLTAAHVVEDSGPVQVRWIDGRVDRADPAGVILDRSGADIAAVVVRGVRRDVQPLPVANRVPAAGEWLEVCGYGTGGTRLRNYYVQVQSRRYTGSDEAQPGPIHGDSGGGIVTADHAGRFMVASVVSAGSGPREIGGERAYSSLIYPQPEIVQAFVSRLHEKWTQTQYPPSGGEQQRFCPPGGCPPGGGGGYQQNPLFPPGEPFRLGPRDRGPEHEPEPQPPFIQQPERSGPDPTTGLAVVLAAAAAAAFIALGRRIR